MSAFQYNITANTLDSHQATNYWLAVVIPLLNQSSYNFNPDNPGSVSQLNTVAIQEGPLIKIVDDCISWQVSAGKDAHTSNLSMTLMKSETPYLDLINGGDWIIFWAFDNYDDFNTVLQNVNSLKRSNFFNIAPKFVGRVSTIIKEKNTDVNSGTRSVFYSMTCYGFYELEGNMYFDALLTSLNTENVSSFFSLFEGPLKEDTALGPLVTTSQIVPKLVKLCLGTGPSGIFKTGGQSNEMVTTPNEAFLVPKTVGKLLMDPNILEGNTIKSVGITYVDLLQMYIGTQTYVSGSDQTPANLRGLIPDTIPTGSPNIYNTTLPMSGWHQLVPLQFDNQSIWSIISQYIGEPINELYTCMKISQDGYVLPTLVCRQIPFSTNTLADQSSSVTKFLELPRWNIDKSMVLQIKTGKSNILRKNYVHIMPTNFANTSLAAKQTAFVYSQPVADSEDIKRNTLQSAWIGQIGAVIYLEESGQEIQKTQGRWWNVLMADSYFNGHLKWSGTILCKGIQKPICEGDNVVVDNIIYHIERVSHVGSTQGDGKKDFNTMLQVSMGVSTASDSDSNGLFVYPKDIDDDDLSTMGDFH